MVLEDFGDVESIGEIVVNDLAASWVSIDKVCDVVLIPFVNDRLLTRHIINLYHEPIHSRVKPKIRLIFFC